MIEEVELKVEVVKVFIELVLVISGCEFIKRCKFFIFDFLKF